MLSYLIDNLKDLVKLARSAPVAVVVFVAVAGTTGYWMGTSQNMAVTETLRERLSTNEAQLREFRDRFGNPLARTGEYARLTDLQLRDAAFQLSAEIRAYLQRMRGAHDSLLDVITASPTGMTDSVTGKLNHAVRQALDDIGARERGEYDSAFRTTVVMLRNELLWRLPPEIVREMEYVPPWPDFYKAEEMADYVEQLARSLPSNRMNR